MSQNATLRVAQAVPIWLTRTQTWLHNLVRFLPDHVENHVVTDRTENLDQFPATKIHSLKRGPRWRYVFEKALRRYNLPNHSSVLEQVATKFSVGLVHSHFGHVGFRNLTTVRRTGQRHVVSFYGMDISYMPKQDERWLGRYRRLFEAVDRVLCEGPHMADTAARLGCPRHKLRVHRLGICPEKIRFRPRQLDASRPLRVLIAATFREKKGIPYGLEALGRLRSRRGTDLEITIIGDADGRADSRREKRRILDKIARFNLGSATRMLGYQPYDVLVAEAYAHDIFLAPSVTAASGDTEGGAPVVLIEMAASGMPVVSTRHCDIPQILEDRCTGVLAGERDVVGLVRGLEWLLDHPEQWQPLTRAARAHIELNFDARQQGMRLAEIYREVATT